MRQSSAKDGMATHFASVRAKFTRLGSWAAPFGLAVACLLAAAPVHAKPIYPGKLVDAGATCVVTCLTCHTKPEGGALNLRFDSAGMPFGALFGAAVSTWAPNDKEAQAALDKFGASTSDADHDNVSDLAEVKAGRDPLLFGARSICTPTYGCGARIAHASPSNNLATACALLMATAVLGLAGRRRSKSRSL